MNGLECAEFLGRLVDHARSCSIYLDVAPLACRRPSVGDRLSETVRLKTSVGDRTPENVCRRPTIEQCAQKRTPAPGTGHGSVKPPGRAADTRLPLACVHPLSRGLRRLDARDGRGASSNPGAASFTEPVDTPGERLGEGRDEVWTIRAYACGQREEDARGDRIPRGADYPRAVDKNSLRHVDAIVHPKDTHIGSEPRSWREDTARTASSHRA